MAISFPANPNENDSFTSNGKTWVWSGGRWKIVGASNRGLSLEISDSAPPNAVEGDMWYESDTGKTFVYYDSYWIEVGAGYPVGTVRVTDQDINTDALYDKVVAGENIELTVVNAGAVEQLRISAPSLAAYTIALGG
jgi:hypothetical protein